MVAKEGIDVFSTKLFCPVAPLFLFFCCHNDSIAGASSVAMETNVESQLWFCLRGPLRLEHSWRSSHSCFSFTASDSAAANISSADFARP